MGKHPDSGAAASLHACDSEWLPAMWLHAGTHCCNARALHAQLLLQDNVVLFRCKA
jgi:hypothetical protein